MEIAIVKFSDLSKQRALRMDASYWVNINTKDSFLKKLADNIVKYRKQQNMSQTQLAKLCDCYQQNIQRMEAGKIMPSIYFIHKISVALGIEIKDLIK